jgi:hypothetical protein
VSLVVPAQSDIAGCCLIGIMFSSKAEYVEHFRRKSEGAQSCG